jgi:hypothetical protein
VGFVVDEVAQGQVFGEYFIPPIAPHSSHHPTSGDGTIGQIVAYPPNGVSLASQE